MELTVCRGFRSLYTKGEEIFNAVSHIVGGALGLAGTVVLLIFARGAREIVSSAAFGLGVIVLYTMSALYHFLPSGRAKGVFRKFDHCTIYLLIAGTYTPYCLIPLAHTAMGWTVFAIEWGCAAAGIVMNAVALNNKAVKTVSMVLYIAMGWAAIVFLPALAAVAGKTCVVLLLAGGIAYTAGIAFFAFGKRVRYFHSVWHLFVLLGTVLQYASVFLLL